MAKINLLFYHLLILGAVICFSTTSASEIEARKTHFRSLMLEYNWPVPDPNIIRFPHESSCHHFYLMLSEQDITLQECPEGQTFDYVNHKCSEEHVHCWSRRFGKLKHEALKHKKHFKCPYAWGKYPHLHDCTKYHLCLNNKSKVKKCASYELFDKISRKCIASIDAVCADGSDVVEHGYTCPKTWGSFRFPKDCSKYYECLQKQPSVRTCKKDHLFDDKRNRCSPKQFVRCGSRYNPYEVATSVQPETKPVTLTKHDNKLSSSNDNIAVSTVKEDFIKEQYSSAVPEVNSFSNKASNDYIGISTMSAVKEDLIEEQQSSAIPEVNSFANKASNDYIGISTGKEDFIKEQHSSAIPEVNSFAHKDQLATNTPVPSKYRLLTGEILSVSSVSESKESTVTLSPKDDIVKGSSATEQEIERQQTEMTTDSELKDLSSSNEFIEVSTATGKGEIEVSSQGPISKKTEISNEINVQKFAAESVTKSAEEIQNSSEFPEVTTTSADRKVECPPDDSRCVVDKSGRIIRCPAGVNNLQSHPWDEVQFLDCTESKIHIYSCPPGLIFNPRLKRCLRKFIIRI